MPNENKRTEDRLKRLRLHYPAKSEAELMEIRRFLDCYAEIALSIYLEATEESSRETMSE